MVIYDLSVQPCYLLLGALTSISPTPTPNSNHVVRLILLLCEEYSNDYVLLHTRIYCNHNLTFLLQGFVRIDMSEYQEKHEVSVHR